ncbi:hypothetical protein Cpir12675_006444 [Ceratocystis pirilliformis]|uniref:Complex 1 LYR protein domain-containing protein n=1 Tax=Ceratocystis pirilliformis TaxID=259994 RepID=A0ABR3YHF4_9PEZI
MSFQIPLQKPIQKLHLYRHLLREASYLPRPCRQYVRGQIFHKFRINQFRETRVDEHIDDGYSALRTMRAANAGQLDRMYRIALLTFGRIGEHRVRRINSFMRPDGPRNSEEVEEQLTQEMLKFRNGQFGPKRTHILNQWPLNKFTGYIKTQMNQQRSVPKVMWPKATITKATPTTNVVPEVSIWGTPLSTNGQRYRTAAWWRRTKEKIIPPMTETQFSRLRDLACGINDGKPLEVTPRRAIDQRYLAQFNRQREAEWEFGNDIRASTALVERQKSRPFIKRSGLIDDSPWRVEKWSPLTARNLQRIFLFVYNSASISKLDPVTLERTTTWGKVQVELKKTTSKHNALFSGVDNITGLPPGHQKQSYVASFLAAPRSKKRT